MTYFQINNNTVYTKPADEAAKVKSGRLCGGSLSFTGDGKKLKPPLRKDVFELSCRNSAAEAQRTYYGRIQKFLKEIINPQEDKTCATNLTAASEAAARRATDNKEIQEALVELTSKEAIVIRTKKDALPILKRQYERLEDKDKKNLYVLNINPQNNNGMPKSNTLISKWYAQVNGISDDRVITLEDGEITKKPYSPQALCPEWKQGNKTASRIQRQLAKIKPEDNNMSIAQAREIISECRGKSEDEIFEKYTSDDIVKALDTMNKNVVALCKKGGYTSSLAQQIKNAIEQSGDEPVTFVIPDDCSLSGSSILCDTTRILQRAFEDTNYQNEIKFVFSPMIIGEKAEKTLDAYMKKESLTDENFLRNIHAIAPDGSEKFSNARSAFKSIKDLNNVKFDVAQGAIKAVHFTDTETFRELGQRDFALQQELLYLMQGPISGSGHLFGGFADCGVMVITPTETFEIDGKKYAGKIPTNSVGYMELLGHAAGVLNDEVSDSKGLFTKGTGREYKRYSEWDGLYLPSKKTDRIPIVVENGVVKKRR